MREGELREVGVTEGHKKKRRMSVGYQGREQKTSIPFKSEVLKERVR